MNRFVPVAGFVSAPPTRIKAAFQVTEGASLADDNGALLIALENTG